jgi:hypothetical protein
MALDAQLELSDEDFLKQDFSELEAQFKQEETDAEDTTDINDSEEEQTSEDELNEDANQIEASESNTEETEEDDSVNEVTDLDEDTQIEDETLSDDTDPESQDTDVTTNEDVSDTDGDTQETENIDYEGAYKRILSPFKASKTTMQVHNIDDAIKLMQMGADYSSKMKAIKPNLKLVSMLEREGLLDENKLNNLIDISKKNPKAIAKLIKDSGIDPLDIDTEEEVDYKPNNYGISDKEFALNQAIDDIRESKSFDQTLNIMSKDWDQESKKIVSDHPDIINVINTHVEMGIYDRVNGIVEQERAVGRLKDVPDVVAYKQVAEYLQSQGVLFDKEEHNNLSPSASVPKKTKANKDAKFKQKRKAAASTKKTSSKKTKVEKDYLKMSDEDFMKEASQF